MLISIECGFAFDDQEMNDSLSSSITVEPKLCLLTDGTLASWATNTCDAILKTMCVLIVTYTLAQFLSLGTSFQY